MRAPCSSFLVPLVLASCQFNAPGVPGSSPGEPPAGSSDASPPTPGVDGAPGVDARPQPFDAAAPADAAGQGRKRLNAHLVDSEDMNMNGVLSPDEWNSAEWIEISAPADYVDEGPTEMPDSTDISAQFAVQYAPGEALYLAIKVIDDVHTNEGHSAPVLYNGDSVQIGLDMGNNGESNGTNNYDNTDDYEYGWALTNPENFLTYQWHSPSGPGEPPSMGIWVSRDGQRKETIYEIMLTRDLLGQDADLQPDRQFGFTLMVNDNDSASPGALRNGYIKWTDGIGILKQPALFGIVTLIGDRD